METLRFHYFNNSYQKHKSSDFILINKKICWSAQRAKKRIKNKTNKNVSGITYFSGLVKAEYDIIVANADNVDGPATCFGLTNIKVRVLFHLFEDT